jgi:hypothetical protein
MVLQSMHRIMVAAVMAQEVAGGARKTRTSMRIVGVVASWAA